MTDFAAFALAIREAREQAGLSQTDFAVVFGHTPGWLSRLEAGTRDPSIADLELLSQRFGLRLEEGLWCVGVAASSGTNL